MACCLIGAYSVPRITILSMTKSGSSGELLIQIPLLTFLLLNGTRCFTNVMAWSEQITRTGQTKIGMRPLSHQRFHLPRLLCLTFGIGVIEKSPVFCYNFSL